MFTVLVDGTGFERCFNISITGFSVRVTASVNGVIRELKMELKTTRMRNEIGINTAPALISVTVQEVFRLTFPVKKWPELMTPCNHSATFQL